MTAMFSPLYPWQQQSWVQLTSQYPNMAHALLFAGLKGTGKHDFVQKFIAWALCNEKDDHAHSVACGKCQSCLWLKAETHPNFLYVTVTDDSKSDTIKVEDVRKILPFALQSSQGMRIVFIEKAERMNVSSANALLKVLEEPPKNVLFLLTSDKPKLLLPTIHSRVQSINVSQVATETAVEYLKQLTIYQHHVKSNESAKKISPQQLLSMVDGAPLLINTLLEDKWIQHRQTWLKVWQALRGGQRDAVSACQYWQKLIPFSHAAQLQLLMCRDLYAIHNDIAPIQTDLDFSCLQPLPSVHSIHQIENYLYQSEIDLRQNIQQAYLYEGLLTLMGSC